MALWDVQTHSSTTVAAILTEHKARTVDLRSCHFGTTAPSSPVEGELWLSSAATPYVLKQYGDHDGTGAAWHEIPTLTALTADLEGAFKQIKEGRMENRGTAGATGSAHSGYLYFLTGDGEAYFVDDTIDNAVKKLCAVVVGTTQGIVDIPLDPVLGIPAATPPTETTFGTTPVISGWLMDAVNEVFTLRARVPQNYSADGDLTLQLMFALAAAETANDDINATVDLVAFADTENPNKTSTQASTDHDIGADNAQYDFHIVEVTLDYDDADNPIAAGDNLVMGVYLDSIASVAGVILLGAALKYPVNGAIQ